MSIRNLLNQCITIENPTGTRDLQGKRALGAAVEVRSRFERTNKTIVTPEREREPINGVVFLAPEAVVEIGARITYNTIQYRVMTIDDVVVGTGKRHHLELNVQLWSFAG